MEKDCSDLTYVEGFKSLNILITTVFQLQNIAIIMTVLYLKNIHFIFDDLPVVRYIAKASMFTVFKDPDR